MLKIAVLAPMPNPKVMIAVAAKPGFLRSWRIRVAKIVEKSGHDSLSVFAGEDARTTLASDPISRNSSEKCGTGIRRGPQKRIPRWTRNDNKKVSPDMPLRFPSTSSVLPPQRLCRRTDAFRAGRAWRSADRASPCTSSRRLACSSQQIPSPLRRCASRGFRLARRPAESDGVPAERTRHGHALLLAARELRRIMPQTMRHADALQRLLTRCLRSAPGMLRDRSAAVRRFHTPSVRRSG